MLTRKPVAGLNKRDMIAPKHIKPRGVLQFSAAESTTEQHWRYWPSADLAPFVEHYWTIEWNLREAQLRGTLPHPSVHIIFESGLAQLAGVFTQKFTRTLQGTGRVFSVKFRPGGFRPFVASPIHVFSNRVLMLQDVFGDTVQGFADRVLAHADHRAAIEVIESFLRGCKPQPAAAVDLAARIAERIAGDRAITKTEQIVAEFDIGARKLQRLFSEYVGVSPKWVIQRYRLHEAIERIAAGMDIDWVSTALDLGYADQPHFIRDFKKLVGKSPADYLRTATQAR